MFKRSAVSILALFLVLGGLGQNYLDGSYVKPPHLSIAVDSLHYYHHNSMFRSVQKSDTRKSIDLDSARIPLHTHFEIAKKLFDDCVYIDPQFFYANQSQVHQPQESYFFLKYISDQYIRPLYSEIKLPNSLRFYLDTNDLSIEKEQVQLNINPQFEAPYEAYLTPFYFRKYEVTNAEYRQFVDWVRDSIARTLLAKNTSDAFTITTTSGENRLNWQIPIPWDDPDIRFGIDEMFLLKFDHFRNGDFIDKRQMDFRLIDSITGYSRELINIFPNEISWTEDFPYSFNEPMANLYFQHPAYDDYPVVGISYHQVQAYLQWRTMMEQEELNRKGIKAKIEYRLPTEAQWDFAATAEFRDKKIRLITKHYELLSDNSWVTDLILKEEQKFVIDTLENTKYYLGYDYVFSEFLKENAVSSDFTLDGSFHTQKVHIEEEKDLNPFNAMNKDANGICFMGGNVSEWIDASYVDSWKPVFEMRQQALATFDREEMRLISETERYFDAKNAPNGKLIRGANWYDERYSGTLGKNVAGMNAKTFASPDSSFSTVGFRYVVIVTYLN